MRYAKTPEYFHAEHLTAQFRRSGKVLQRIVTATAPNCLSGVLIPPRNGLQAHKKTAVV